MDLFEKELKIVNKLGLHNILQQYPDVIYTGINYDEVLIEVCEKNRDDLLKVLLLSKYYKELINVNYYNEYGECALMSACYENSKECVELLLKHPDIEVNMYDMNDYSALLHVCIYNYKECCKMLLKHPDIDVNSYDIDGVTSLGWANYENNKEIETMLIVSGAKKEALSLHDVYSSQIRKYKFRNLRSNKKIYYPI